MSDRKYNLMIARFPGNHSEHPDSSDYVTRQVLKAHASPDIDQTHVWRKSDTPVHMVRNLCIWTAQQQKDDYVLMIDNDMCPDYIQEAPKFLDVAWSFMMDRREREEQGEELPPATIGAPYCTSGADEKVVGYRFASRTAGDARTGWNLTCFDRDAVAEKTGVEQVAALGTGLILYDMRVFERLPPPWFDYEYADEPYRTRIASTEDIYQTRNAHFLGLPQYIAWDCWAVHHKLKPIPKPTRLDLKNVHDTYLEAMIAEAFRRGKLKRAEEPATNP